MSRIILPPGFILPPYHFAPYHFAPWKSFNVHYFPIPVSFCPPPPPSFCPPGNCSMIYTIYPCPVSFCPLDSFCPHIILPPIILPPPPWKWFNDLHYLPMSCIILPPALDFVFILKKTLYNKSLWQARIRWLWHLWFLFFASDVHRFLPILSRSDVRPPHVLYIVFMFINRQLFISRDIQSCDCIFGFLRKE